MHIVDSAKRLVKYSWLLQVLVERDLKIRYRRSFLGYLWSVLNPLLMMIILTIVFSNMFRFDIPQYPVYLLAGQLIFGFYSEATSMAMGSILGGAALIKKVYLPKYIFPLSRVISSFTSMLLSMIALFYSDHCYRCHLFNNYNTAAIYISAGFSLLHRHGAFIICIGSVF